MQTISTQALLLGYLFRELVEAKQLERQSDVLAFLETEEELCAGEYLHMLANVANMLAKEDSEFFRLKGKILTTFCRYSDGSVQVFADREEGIVLLISARFGVTAFHHAPAQLEKETNYKIVDAHFRWSGFARQAMALDEVFDLKLRRINIEQSSPKRKRDMMTDWNEIETQVRNAADKTAIISIVEVAWGPYRVSKSMRKKSLEALRQQVLGAVREELRVELAVAEGPEIADLRARIARLDQQRCSKLLSYADARNPQKVLDEADAHSVEMAELEEKIRQLQA